MLALLAAVTLAGCRPATPPADTVDVRWTLRPEPPVVGPATLTITLGEPHAAASGTTVGVIGHMTHPGMVPIRATIAPRGSGIYDAGFAFTMAGDWVLVLTVQLADGRRLERRIEVKDVRAVPAPPA